MTSQNTTTVLPPSIAALKVELYGEFKNVVCVSVPLPSVLTRALLKYLSQYVHGGGDICLEAPGNRLERLCAKIGRGSCLL